MTQKLIRIGLALAFSMSPALAQSKPIPQLVKKDGKFRLMVDGQPFVMLGGQVGKFQRVPGDYGALLEPVQSHEPEHR